MISKIDIRVLFTGSRRASISIADRIIERITARFKLLAEHPIAGKSAGHMAAKVGCFSVGKYLIYCRKTRPSLEVLRIFHSAREQKPSFRAKT